ncbi:hypothetical protein [Campylobacter hyointestinalis]|uniref:Uncharacterized protein n=2 Tax=Campylobacter hyointestinalis TaxID=198 RepID=A0AAV6ECS7_CAMHY|nr:hypothetical protein [Campylobacter hyointestinalis]ANE34495.1 hypothetical protein CHL_1152 [Campylobacter hyointestinalis subsp. lawsonii CCUG 27631]KAB0612059.1 hypothetical protein F7P66_06875 [Campylobacter hyointestinalis subsp. lawsonii]QKF69318.1 hypothetical protein CHLWT_0741 [Campylobacter hyointestinalis subsp. lawsonii]RAZ28233.1 hypothetical protein CHLT_04940 [Campylobacter hyointestinalis subsp. lawsonii]RAZ49274.1 hypothetical protein CHL9004_07660 [Campylobacter hyointesti
MSYSFIKPKLKPIFSMFSKIWIMLIVAVVFIFFCINIAIKFGAYSLNTNSQSKQEKYDSIVLQITEVKKEIAVLTSKRDAALNIYSSNNILKKSLQNLFDLVPDSVTLNNVFLDKNLLIIKGVTPSKDTYQLLMEAPLKSIFSSSSTTFYQMPNGWLNFISTNKIENSEGFNE